MALLACQLDYVCNELKSKWLGTLVRDLFLIKSFELGRPASNPDLLRWEDPL